MVEIYLYTEQEINGDSFTPIEYYSCNECENLIRESDPHYEDTKAFHLCWDCSFKEGFISGQEYLNYVGFHSDMFNVYLKNNEIQITRGKIPSDDMSNRELRNTEEYRRWRKNVFERDNYTCQACNQRGGELNAHHIKHFAKYPHLRFDINNGLTLCKSCHIEKHRKE